MRNPTPVTLDGIAYEMDLEDALELEAALQELEALQHKINQLHPRASRARERADQRAAKRREHRQAEALQR